MGRKRKPYPIFKEVTIIDTAAEGKSMAKIDEKVVFVPLSVPGDIVDIQITRKRRRFMEGKVIHFHHYSEKRVEPFCEHFGVCGGCKWQLLSYEDQLANKARTVKDSIERIGKQENPPILPIIAAPETQFYRNKLEFTFSNKEWLTQEQIDSGEDFDNRNALGFHIPGRFDKILDIKKCWLQDEPSNSIRLWVKEYAVKHELTFFDLREQNGFLRNLIIRTSTNGEVMCVFAFAKEDKEKREALLNAFHEVFPQVNSLMYVINDKRNDTIGDLEIEIYNGADHIVEEMPSYDREKTLKFKIGPKSFYQTNSEQAHTLYHLAADFAEIKKDEMVYDLYTGTGTIAQFIASQAKEVIGIEYVEAAIEDAKINAEVNEIENTRFFAGDMKDIFTPAFLKKHGNADVVITDPPRAGMHADVINSLIASKANRIVYISCNPATQARDIELLSEYYTLEKIQGVDMFPQTHHVESVALLKRTI